MEKYYYGLIFAWLFLYNLSAENIIGTVTADKLNIRSQGQPNSSILCQVKKGDKVTILEFKDEWLKIVVPQNASAWVFSKFIDNKNTLMGDNIYVRSGPGIAYHHIGKLPLKTKVEILKKTGQWSKIKPLVKFLSAWVSSRYIDYFENSANQNVPDTKVIKEVVNKQKKTTITEKKVLPKAVFENDKYTVDKIQKKKVPVIHTGYVLIVEKNNDYVDYALAKKHGEKYFPICYLKGFKDELKEYIFKRIKIVGTQYFINGWYRPIVYVNNFEELTEDN